MDTTQTPLTLLRLWTVEEYHRMAKVGILQPDEPVELIAGQIIRQMSPQGTPHATAIRLTRRLLDNRLREQGLVQTQLPIQLSNYSEPEPDLAVVMPDELRYLDHHPTPSEIYLIIEVADTTLKRDCELKANHYAEAKIADYWVIDLSNRQLHVFRKPTDQGYQSQVIIADNQTILPLQFSDCLFTVSEMLPPVIPEFVED
ncbi:MAG: Uma2 family endonuclease [Moorea sp. SIO3I7]|uniref:Uma2 family endonuclease n=1 Tax=unclassified Moorena TaxID=2683338 RepID=UPI0013C01078|nr:MULTISPECIES: Uma2 family endonuclease [unclassified Moorena]NEN98068.1 Uma2 family endonuclease [Moorena sp. SIO3I7]NEO10025.1 Uma2 family endonuclease [Moorena sp. SIO3I8]NEP24665.1 Uma2 family endonuclease [Moorena sp. SIO3I6]